MSLFFERPQGGEKAVLVHLELGGEEPGDVAEFVELVRSAGGDPVALISGRRERPDPRHFVGAGKLEELRAALAATEAELAIFDHELSPSQERNLERALGCRVLDRTGLILDIFAQRARTYEGKLQVERAQLEHLSTRLVRGWTHLERQKGGIGLRGPGETQLESDRRLVRERIRAIDRRLERVRRSREQGRRGRRRAALPAVSLVGYTNAGKSTLFNRLTAASVLARDQLFATLDPTLRRLVLPGFGPVVFADTVGFLSRLPHQLVAAFRATLEEVVAADLLLHVVDASSPRRREQMEAVTQVLAEIGAGDNPVLVVYNKIDLLGEAPRLERNPQGRPAAVWVSAQSGAGLDLLLSAVAECLAREAAVELLRLPPSCGRLRARLYALSAVSRESPCEDGGVLLEVRLPRSDLERLLASEGLSLPAVAARTAHVTMGATHLRESPHGLE
ncbi:MAG: GTPase HflX [Porticoccaceae bacterium]|nr:MAG: GTPase HflX [Porticoccaceae bacterium]